MRSTILDAYNELCAAAREAGLAPVGAFGPGSEQANIDMEYETYPDEYELDGRAHVVMDEEARRARAAGEVGP